MATSCGEVSKVVSMSRKRMYFFLVGFEGRRGELNPGLCGGVDLPPLSSTRGLLCVRPIPKKYDYRNWNDEKDAIKVCVVR